MVYSTTRVPLAVAGANPRSEMNKQATYAVIAFAAFVATVFFDYRRYLSWAPVLYVGSMLLLLATLAIGRTTLGATSWIQVGSIEVEPAEDSEGHVHHLAGRPAGQPEGQRHGPRRCYWCWPFRCCPSCSSTSRTPSAAPWCWRSSWSGCC